MQKKLSHHPQPHRPVLKDELLQALAPLGAAICIDATFGAGGHSQAVLAQIGKRGVVLGIDRDEQAIVMARENFAAELQARRLHLYCQRFSQLPAIVTQLGWQGKVDCLYADLGFSSTQMFDPTRGFSIHQDGPLDMRLSPHEQQMTAADLVNGSSQEQLAQILRDYGEEPHAVRIARHLVQNRPITRTGQLATLVAAHTRHRRNQRLHPATRVFQALRIAVNDELGELRQLLDATTFALLRPGGRLAIITFHSLEDRLVKHSFRKLAGLETKDPAARHLPIPACPPSPLATIIKPFPVQPQAQEIYNNRRARSAKLRVIAKTS